MEKAIQKLKELAGKKTVILTRRGNKAIKFSLRRMKELGRKKVLVQDQGGWLTYTQYAGDFRFELVKLKTDNGIVDIDDLKKNVDENSVLLINSMPGYFVFEDMEKIAEIAKKSGAVLINDASGSIGTENAKFGEIIVGSFSKWKPLDVGYGGFIATDGDYFGELQSVFDEKWVPKLAERLDNLDKRIKALKSAAEKIKKDLKEFGIIHREADGFNVVVRFKTEQEKEKILNYCEKNNLEYTICPRYIRVNENAVCIEAKRK